MRTHPRTRKPASTAWGVLALGALVSADAVGRECGSELLTQSNDLTSMLGSAATVCMAAGDASAENNMARRFLIGDDPFQLRCVDFGIHLNWGEAWTIEVRVYQGTPTSPFATLQPLGSAAVVVPAYSSKDPMTATFDPPLFLPADASITIELHTDTRDPSDGGDGGILVFGFDSAGQVGPSYLRTATCSTGEFSDLATVGLANSHLLLAMRGEIGSAPCLADLNRDSSVDAADSGSQLGAWAGGGAPDLDGSGSVDAADLSIL